MDRISRRDFLNGVALTIAAGLTPAMQVAAQPLRYPPALIGLRGQHEGAFEVAHSLAFEQKNFAVDDLPIEERYDLVVVGAGISGLAAAWFYRRIHPNARILILDNHDDFGGHAKRNEFDQAGRLILGYGGSESLQSPRALFSDVAKGLLRDLRVDIARFDTAFERELYPSLGLSRGVFFPRETFGRDTLVPGDPLTMNADELGPNLLNARPVKEFVADFPISDASKAQLMALFEQTKDPLAGKTVDDKLTVLSSTSYRDYLTKICGASDQVADCFQGRTLDFFALGIDAVSALDAHHAGFPGFDGLGLPKESNPERDEAYIHHFPDGNASIARLLVRAMVPGVASGHSMDDIVLARFDYERLDRDDQNVRIRLDSTCVTVRNAGDAVDVGYVRQGTLHRIAGGHVVLACFSMIIPYIMAELPDAQKKALAQNVKAPLVYTKVLVRNWQAWAKLGVHEISAPMSFHCRVKLDYPVSLGGYRHARDPSEPIGLHLVHVPAEPGLPARDQFRAGRAKLLGMTFADFEREIREQLDRMLGPGGFSSERDIAAITVNRWSHGYSYSANSLFDTDDTDATIEAARKPIGRVVIANSDAGWEAYLHTAVDEAERAVRELVG
jgi:spermidine dehydrogenase